MMQQDSVKELELAKGEVTSLDGRHSFVAVKTDSDMSFFNHRDIVRTVSDC
jgi:hypothetical protein